MGCARRIYRGQSSFEETQKLNNKKKKKTLYVAFTLHLVLEEASLLQHCDSYLDMKANQGDRTKDERTALFKKVISKDCLISLVA